MDKEAAIRHCIACCDGALTDEQRSELSSRIGGAIEAYAADEYERGKGHGADDRRMIERRNQEQGREVRDLKGKIGRMKMEATAIANALGERGLLDFADDVRMLAKL